MNGALRKLLPFAVLTALNVAIAYGVWGWTPFAPKISEAQIDYGTQMASEAQLLRSATGRPGQLLVLFVNKEVLSSSRNRVTYALSVAPRFQSGDLDTVIVTTGHMPSLAQTRPAVTTVADDDGTLFRAFHISPRHSHGGLVILSRRGELLFRTPGIPAEDEYRQLAEKHSVGAIDYRAVDSRMNDLFRIGTSMPSLDARPVSPSATHRAATAAATTVVLLASSCSSCQLKEFESDLASLQARLVARGQPDKLSVIFDDTFADAAISSYMKSGHAVRNVYKSNLRGLLTNGYDTRVPDVMTPMVITINQSGVISAASPLRLF
jgi:hypothetical protein